jgi:hypothetical protein
MNEQHRLTGPSHLVLQLNAINLGSVHVHAPLDGHVLAPAALGMPHQPRVGDLHGGVPWFSTDIAAERARSTAVLILERLVCAARHAHSH